MAQRRDNLEQNFLDTIKENNLINEGDVIVVGVSGGPDSITLLTCLNKYKEKLKYSIIVAHINHLIREDSTEDEQFVEDACEKMNIKFYAKRINVEQIAKETKRGTEETGRTIRYDFFNEILKKEHANKIAIAHNMNDNAETMLINLIRGSGLNGLEGIQPQEYKKYIRPLINCTRTEIEEYCDKYNLEPRIDYTNKENIYTRNIIRNQIIPKLEEINPNIINTLSRTSKIIKENNNYTKIKAQEAYQKLKDLEIKEGQTTIIDKKGIQETTNIDKKQQQNSIQLNKKKQINLDAKEFNKLENTIKTNVIIFIIEELQGTSRNTEKANIDDIIKLAQRNIGNKYVKINKNLEIKLQDKKLQFIFKE